eukprot:SAG31_NODE_9504_length_1267_cov_1.398973_1_plen_89_part_01
MNLILNLPRYYLNTEGLNIFDILSDQINEQENAAVDAGTKFSTCHCSSCKGYERLPLALPSIPKRKSRQAAEPRAKHIRHRPLQTSCTV